MENKILAQDLAEFLSQRNGITKKKAEGFVRAFFDVILWGLEQDKFVKIKGFGTFKMVAVGERESVNINTGERFQIQGHSKISFTPDSNLKDLVNRPFAHFQTVVLNDETSLEELENINADDLLQGITEFDDTQIEDDLRELSKQINLENKESSAVNEKEEEKDINIAQSILIKEGDTHENLIVETGSEEVITEEFEDATVEDVEPIGNVDNTNGNMVLGVEDSPKEDDTSNKTDNDKAEDVELDPESITGLGDQVESECVSQNCTNDEESEEVSCENELEKQSDVLFEKDNTRYILCENPQQKFNWWKFIALTLLFVIMMVVSYFVGYYRLLCPCTYEQVGVSTIQQVGDSVEKSLNDKGDIVDRDGFSNYANSAKAYSLQDSDSVVTYMQDDVEILSKSASDEVIKSNDNKKKEPYYKQVEGGKYQITGTKRSYRVDKGETIRTIAQQIYGSKGYAPYIIAHNDLKNPDNIDAGIIINLPELVLK